MAYTTINDPEKYFKTVLWTGNLFANSITGVNHQPDLLWFKNRNTTNNFEVRDSTRGTGKGGLRLDDDAVEGDDATRITSFDSDGFTISTDPSVNGNQNKILAWSWAANGGTRTTNTESGNNPGGGFQANTTAGFSIVDYTGTGAAGTMAHGLGAVPHWILFKSRSEASNNWAVYHHRNTAAPETDFLRLDTNAATTDNANFMNDTAPTSSVFTVNDGSKVNSDGETYIAYAWTEVKGFSKFGQYYGNGNAEGPFVYTGFKPAWVVVKKTSATHSWYTQYQGEGDTHGNPVKFSLTLDNPQVDISENSMDFLSNGFKLRTSGNGHNTNDVTYVYAAFAESPFVTSNGVPGVAG